MKMMEKRVLIEETIERSRVRPALSFSQFFLEIFHFLPCTFTISFISHFFFLFIFLRPSHAAAYLLAIFLYLTHLDTIYLQYIFKSYHGGLSIFANSQGTNYEYLFSQLPRQP